MLTTDIRPRLNSVYPVNFFSDPTAYFDLYSQTIYVIHADPDTGAQFCGDIITPEYDPSITDYSAYIIAGLINDYAPYALAD